MLGLITNSIPLHNRLLDKVTLADIATLRASRSSGFAIFGLRDHLSDQVALTEVTTPHSQRYSMGVPSYMPRPYAYHMSAPTIY